jgi:hypothetical protein
METKKASKLENLDALITGRWNYFIFVILTYLTPLILEKYPIAKN